MELSDSDIETHGKQLLELFLSHADGANFNRCARMCDYLWSKNVPKDTKWAGGRDSLHFAISKNCCVEMCKFLVTRGYEVHSHLTTDKSNPLNPTTMLQDAVKNFNARPISCAQVIDFLLEYGVSMEFPPGDGTLLETVLGLNHGRINLRYEVQRMFEKLMALGASVNPPPGRYFLPAKPEMSVLCNLIAFEYDDDLIFRVINDTKDVDQHGGPLAMALRHGRIAIVDRLLSRGAKVNHPPRRGFRGILQAACSPVASFDAQKNVRAYVRLVERLIVLGADVHGSAELTMGGTTPLQHAAYEGMIEMACLLMKHGADVNAGCLRPWEKPTCPLDYAAGYGRLDMVHLLRGAGALSAHPGITGVDGAIKCAEEGRHYSISDFLRSTIDRSNI